MAIIKNKDDFEEFYPYDKKYIDKYPNEYPCVCKWENEGGGLMGDYRQVYVTYFPKNISSNDAFLIGLRNPWTILT